MDRYATSWRELLTGALESHSETWADIISIVGGPNREYGDQDEVVPDNWLDVTFDSSYGGTEGHAFTAWTKDWVYFPICYDGSEWVGWAPRNPCSTAMHHQGGG